MRGKRAAILFVVILNFLCFSSRVSANEPYSGYIYNAWGESVASPNGYLPDVSVTGVDLGVGAFKEPKDMFRDKNNDIYILDSGNGRIVVTDADLKLKKVIGRFQTEKGEEKLNNPSGIFVDLSGTIYIADKENSRVIAADGNGTITRIFKKPASDIFPSNVAFKPEKVVKDSTGTVYVLVKGLYYGAVMYDPDGNFLGFYGSNRVESTAQLLADYFWKKLLTKEQKEKMSRYVPVEYSNFAIDAQNFIYTCTKSAGNGKDIIKKLNPLGNNILNKVSSKTNVAYVNRYGDLEKANYKRADIVTQLVDICVDDEGFINALDYTRGRVFQYDSDGNLMFIFGGPGSMVGNFKSPAAIESIHEKVLVLDDRKGSITAFRPTSFGSIVRQAVQLYNRGFYEEAVKPWKEVLKRNSNYELAYIGMGKAFMNSDNYAEAMKYFKLGYDRTGYSKAYKELRTNTLRDNFPMIMLVISIIAVVLWVLRRKISNIFAPLLTLKGKFVKAKYPVYILFHPIEGFEELRWNKGGSLPVSAVILFLWFMAAVFVKQLTGFSFNTSRPDQINMLFVFAGTVILFAVWSVSNWAFCTLQDGEGTFSYIWIATSYALVPYITVSFMTTFLSNFLIVEEGIFLTWLLYIGQGYSMFLLVSGLRTIHQFTFPRTILSIVLTVFGIIAAIFLSILVFSLFKQLYVWVYSIMSEISYRL